MANRILTTHVGSLPRPRELLEFSQKRLSARSSTRPPSTRTQECRGRVVRQQKEAGVDLINDGELGHTVGWAYDYGAWWST